MTDDHQPPQRTAQGGPQARRPASGATSWARSSPRARTWSTPPTRAGWRAVARATSPPAPGCDGEPGRAARAGRGLPARLGHAGDRRLRRSAGRRPVGPPLRRAVGRRRPRQRRHGAALRARLRRRARSRSARAAPTRTGHKAVRASMGALFSVPVARVRNVVASCPAAAVALVARAGAPLDELRARRRADARGRRRARGPARPTSSPPATTSPTSRSRTPTR